MHLAPDPNSDQQLILDFLKHRSERVFRELYRRHAARLHRLALHFANYDPVHADEAAQETWITAVQKLPAFGSRSTFRTWLTGILINKVRELRKANNRNTTEGLSHDLAQGVAGYPGIHLDLQRSLAALTPGYHQVLILHDAEGYTHQEIAELLGISEGTSKSQLFEARRKVRKYLNE